MVYLAESEGKNLYGVEQSAPWVCIMQDWGIRIKIIRLTF